jgi:hypothetical protein
MTTTETLELDEVATSRDVDTPLWDDLLSRYDADDVERQL